jgi:hypothetical protein
VGVNDDGGLVYGERVCLVTAGVFEVVCAASGSVAANRIKAREIFKVGAALITFFLMVQSG